MKLKLLALFTALLASLVVIGCQSLSSRTDSMDGQYNRNAGTSDVQHQGSVTRLKVDQCYVVLDTMEGFHANRDSDEDRQLEKRTWLRVNFKETDDNGETWYTIGYRGSYASIQEAYIIESDASRQLSKLLQKKHPWCGILEKATYELIVTGA